MEYKQVKFTKNQQALLAQVLKNMNECCSESYAERFGYLESAIERISNGEECYLEVK